MAVVKHAYQFLNKSGAPCLRIEDVANAYRAADHPRVRTREKRAETVLAEFVEGIQYRAPDGNINE